MGKNSYMVVNKNNILFLLVLVLSISLISVLESYAQAAKQRDSSIVAVNELNDLEGNEWAYQAVQGLVEKYDVLEGYPDGTFRGKKPSTRFELAAAVYDLATYFSDEIALDREDLAKLAKLLDEFSSEIKTIQAKVDEIEKKVITLESKTTTLEGQVASHTTQLDEHEKRLAYAERRKGFILERLVKGIFIDLRDISRGISGAIFSPFNKNTRDIILRK